MINQQDCVFVDRIAINRQFAADLARNGESPDSPINPLWAVIADVRLKLFSSLISPISEGRSAGELRRLQGWCAALKDMDLGIGIIGYRTLGDVLFDESGAWKTSEEMLVRSETTAIPLTDSELHFWIGYHQACEWVRTVSGKVAAALKDA